MTKEDRRSALEDDPFVCCGCGKPLDLGEYRSCDCPTGVGFRRGTDETIGKKNRCAWCDAIPIRANLDGDDLCQSCCNKWVRAEGFVDAAPPESRQKAKPRLPNDAPDEDDCWYGIERCTFPDCDCSARSVAALAKTKEDGE